MAEAEKHDNINFRAILATVGGVLLSAVLSTTLKIGEQAFLVGEAAVLDKPAEIFAVHFELLFAAFGILYSAKTAAPTRLAGPLATAYHRFIIAAVSSYCCVLWAGLLSPQYLSDTSSVYLLLRVVLPNTAAIVILVYAALAAQMVARDVRKHVDL